MALTNYIMQSVICTLFFFGYGLELLCRVGVLPDLLRRIAIWIVQLIISPIWLRFFLLRSARMGVAKSDLLEKAATHARSVGEIHQSFESAAASNRQGSARRASSGTLKKFGIARSEEHRLMASATPGGRTAAGTARPSPAAGRRARTADLSLRTGCETNRRANDCRHGGLISKYAGEGMRLGRR